MQLQSAIEGYWLERRRNLSVNTYREYNHVFGRFQQYLTPEIEFESITADHIRKFLNYLRTQNLLDKTISNYWTALSSLWTWAKGELKVEQIITGHVQQPRFTVNPIEPYIRNDVAAMLEACHEKAEWITRHGRRATAPHRYMLRDRAIIATLLDTGLRASELTALTLDDYDKNKGQLYIRRGKGNKGRFVYLGASGRRHRWRYLATRPKALDKEPLFATRVLTHMDRNALRHLIQRCAKRARVANATVHRFRHTFAINFLRNGGNVLELQTLLGHARMETVNIYAKLAQLDLEQAQAKASPADNWRL